MQYVFDSGPLIDLFRHYYPGRFPTLWEKFEELVLAQEIVSVREVFNEVAQRGDRLSAWAKTHREFFGQPTPDELRFVAEIFTIAHFQTLIRKKERLQGQPVADPFVIARASITSRSVVSLEELKPNAAKIPNVCKHFGVRCLNLEEFMENEGWRF